MLNELSINVSEIRATCEICQEEAVESIWYMRPGEGGLMYSCSCKAAFTRSDEKWYDSDGNLVIAKKLVSVTRPT